MIFSKQNTSGDMGIIKVSGPDAQQFLQNMSTNDFAKVEQNGNGFGAFCNAKGRVIASFIARYADNAYYIALPADLVTKVTEHLGKFKLMSKIELTDCSGDFGDGAAPLGYIPREFVWVCEATSEKMIPQSLNLDLAGAVSFSKGCYPGQEIVARMHYLGKLKKRTYRFCADGEQDFAAGADIYAEGQDAPCGIVVDSVCSEGKTHTLAAINIKDREHKLCSPQSGPSLGACVDQGFKELPDSFDPEA